MLSVLKRAYGRQIEDFIKPHINHVTKVEFFISFKATYLDSITLQNAKAGFRGAGLVPFDPQVIISKLDVKLRTPTPIFKTVAALVKDTEILAHEATLLTAENCSLRKSNEALSKRRRAKKSRVHQRSCALTIEDGCDIIAQKNVKEQLQRDKHFEGVGQIDGQSSARHCN